MSKRLPEVVDIITGSLRSGHMTEAEWSDIVSAAGPEDGDGSYQWRENGVEHRRWYNGAREYRSEETQYRWQPYRG